MFNSRPGLLFLNNRYHDPQLGAFISVDPLVTSTGEAYIYAGGNPVTWSDPTGLETFGDLSVEGHLTLTQTASSLCLVDPKCGDATIRSSFGFIHDTVQGQAISAVIDVAKQGDWSKADGNWSSGDIDYAAAFNPVRYLLGGDDRSAAVVARVARSLQGHEGLWEQWDRDRSWGDVVLAGAILALDVVSVASGAMCLAGNPGACVVSGVAGLSATGLSGVATARTCGNAPGSPSCGLSGAAFGIDGGALLGGGLIGKGLTAVGAAPATANGAAGGLTVVLAPVTLGNDGYFLYDSLRDQPFSLGPVSPAAVVGG